MNKFYLFSVAMALAIAFSACKDDQPFDEGAGVKANPYFVVGGTGSACANFEVARSQFDELSNLYNGSAKVEIIPGYGVWLQKNALENKSQDFLLWVDNESVTLPKGDIRIGFKFGNRFWGYTFKTKSFTECMQTHTLPSGQKVKGYLFAGSNAAEIQQNISLVRWEFAPANFNTVCLISLPGTERAADNWTVCVPVAIGAAVDVEALRDAAGWGGSLENNARAKGTTGLGVGFPQCETVYSWTTDGINAYDWTLPVMDDIILRPLPEKCTDCGETVQIDGEVVIGCSCDDGNQALIYQISLPGAKDFLGSDTDLDVIHLILNNGDYTAVVERNIKDNYVEMDFVSEEVINSIEVKIFNGDCLVAEYSFDLDAVDLPEDCCDTGRCPDKPPVLIIDISGNYLSYGFLHLSISDIPDGYTVDLDEVGEGLYFLNIEVNGFEFTIYDSSGKCPSFTYDVPYYGGCQCLNEMIRLRSVYSSALLNVPKCYNVDEIENDVTNIYSDYFKNPACELFDINCPYRLVVEKIQELSTLGACVVDISIDCKEIKSWELVEGEFTIPLVVTYSDGKKVPDQVKIFHSDLNGAREILIYPVIKGINVEIVGAYNAFSNSKNVIIDISLSSEIVDSSISHCNHSDYKFDNDITVYRNPNEECNWWKLFLSKYNFLSTFIDEISNHEGTSSWTTSAIYIINDVGYAFSLTVDYDSSGCVNSIKMNKI